MEESMMMEISTIWEGGENLDSFSVGTMPGDMNTESNTEDKTFHARLSFMSFFDAEMSVTDIVTETDIPKMQGKSSIVVKKGSEDSEVHGTHDPSRSLLIQIVTSNLQTNMELVCLNKLLLVDINEILHRSVFINQVTNQSLEVYFRKLLRLKEIEDMILDYTSWMNTIKDEFEPRLKQLKEEYNTLSVVLNSNLTNKNKISVLTTDGKSRKEEIQTYIRNFIESCMIEVIFDCILAQYKIMFNISYEDLRTIIETNAAEDFSGITSEQNITTNEYHRVTVEKYLRLQKLHIFKNICPITSLGKKREMKYSNEVTLTKKKISARQKEIAQLNKIISSKENCVVQNTIFTKLKSKFENDIIKGNEMICTLLKSIDEKLINQMT